MTGTTAGTPAATPAASDAPKITQLSPADQLNGFSWWKREMSYRLGSMSTPEVAQFEFDYFNRNLPEKCHTCESDLKWMLQYSPSVIFMMDSIRKIQKNPEDQVASHVKCDVCPELQGGGFHPDYGILLCANRLRSKWQLEDVLTHELVHAYDHVKFKVDLANLNHHACTEIRASTLSGECRIFNEIKKTGLGNFGKKFQDCVKRRAALSVSHNPNCKDIDQATAVVDRVWNSCFNDTRPFERVYK
ncbi:mitochondrial inner membrane protease Atp23p [Diutina catenulata]